MRKNKRQTTEEYFSHCVKEYSKEDMLSLKKAREILTIELNKWECRLNNRIGFKDYAFVLTLLAAIYKVWDIEKEFYSIPLINSPIITAFLLSLALVLLFKQDHFTVKRITNEKQDIEIMIRSINFCLENKLYRETIIDEKKEQVNV